MYPRNEEKKEEIYKFINNFMTENNVSPSISEISNGVHCAKSTVHKFLIRLEEEGLIERFGRDQMITKERYDADKRIPVLGAIACGKPKLAIEDIEGYIPINSELFGDGDYFVLIAEGDSMIDIGINSGDLVFIRKQDNAEDGQIVAALVNDEYSGELSATLKRYYCDFTHKKIRLHPENIYMDDIVVDNVKILGVATRILKDLK